MGGQSRGEHRAHDGVTDGDWAAETTRPGQTGPCTEKKRWWMTCGRHQRLARPPPPLNHPSRGQRPLIRLARQSHASVGPMKAQFVCVSACQLACEFKLPDR